MAPCLKTRQFIDRTFAIAQPNLRVNGRMFGDTEDSEPGVLFRPYLRYTC